MWSVARGGRRRSLEYDPLGNLVHAETAGLELDYLLDAEGRRVARLIDGEVAQVWAYAPGALLPFAELDPADGSLIAAFLPGDVVVRNDTSYQLVRDHLGSVRAVYQDDGTLVAWVEYDPWGEVIAGSAADVLQIAPFGYAGGLADPATELVHFAREYDPSLRRWLGEPGVSHHKLAPTPP